MAERLAQVDRSIELAKASLATMEKSYGAAQASLRAQPPNSEAYLELARMSEAGTLAGLRQKVLDLENSKLSPTTKETELVEPISRFRSPCFSEEIRVYGRRSGAWCVAGHAARICPAGLVGVSAQAQSCKGE